LLTAGRVIRRTAVSLSALQLIDARLNAEIERAFGATGPGGSMDVFGHDQTWPEHSNPNYHEALQYAQNAKWTLLKFEGHSWGRIVCDRDLPRGQRCEILVLRSAKGGESFALGIPSKVDGCPHGKGRKRTSPADRLAAAATQLDEAERLMRAARRCLDSQTKRAGAMELLRLAEEAIGSVDDALAEVSLLDQAAELESEAVLEYDEAIGLADAAGYPDDSPVEPEPLLDEASSRVRQVIRDMRGSDDRRRVRMVERARSMRTDIEAMRSELGE
jgi:hypothetical protein